MKTYLEFDTPLGTMRAVADGAALASVDFIDARYVRPVAADWREDARSPLLLECARQMREYFAGQRERFGLPLAPVGTPFREAVWAALRATPPGRPATYAELAARCGRPAAARAAGAEPVTTAKDWVRLPARVVGTSGALTGYAGGLARKSRLHALEHAREDALA